MHNITDLVGYGTLHICLPITTNHTISRSLLRCLFAILYLLCLFGKYLFLI